MKKIFLPICSVLLFVSSCKPRHKGETKPDLLSNFVSITANEDKGIKEIIAFYGGRCEYGFTKRVSLNKENEIDFWLKFSESKSIDSLSHIAELSCSNIAYLFYKNLKEEKNKYKHIESELILGNGTIIKKKFKMSDLEIIKTKNQIIDQIVDLLKTKDYNKVWSYLTIDTSLYNIDKNTFLANVKKAENDFGNPKQFIPYGFAFFKTPGGKEILHISGAIKRENRISSYFSVELDPNSLIDEIYFLNYKL